jgi:hypothetical protein
MSNNIEAARVMTIIDELLDNLRCVRSLDPPQRMCARGELLLCCGPAGANVLDWRGHSPLRAIQRCWHLLLA